MAGILRGEVRWADLNPVRGHEQAGYQAGTTVPRIEQRPTEAAVLHRRAGAQGARCRSTVIVVLDASVVLKWLLEDPAREPDAEKASALVESVVRGTLAVLQPLHWLAEVAAVLARLTPQTAVGDVEMLAALEFPMTDDPNVIRRATSLAIETDHHLFDALYHAVALENDDAVLVTADDRYHRKAGRYGRIAALRDWIADP